MRTVSLEGFWQCEIPGQKGSILLPGTLDEAGIGPADDPAKQWKLDEVRRIGFWQEGDPIVTRLTRKHAFEGEARISRRISAAFAPEERVFADIERARHLRLFVNGKEAPLCHPACISAPYVFELTGLMTGDDELTFLSDNSCPGWPREAIVYSSAATDETQTNWNGLLGTLRLRAERRVFISAVRVYPRGGRADVCVELDAAERWSGTLKIRSAALEDAEQAAQTEAGVHCVWFRGLGIREDAGRWDLETGNLHELEVSGDGLESRRVRFGVRDFTAEDGTLRLNGRRFFLRGEANCAVFPETGYPPMERESWKKLIARYRSYGVNCLRFHSHCPPEAAFEAADEMGMLMQPELSHWNPTDAFSAPEAQRYYQTELIRMLESLANHPSFVMLTFGNELHAREEGRLFMNKLLALAREKDATRLYANASNPDYGQAGPDPASDFYTSSNAWDQDLRATSAGPSGWLNREGPDWRRNYASAVSAIRKITDQPVFSFEVGQYEVLPDFDEIGDYRGVTEAANLMHIRRKVQEAGLEDEWKRQVEASGELSLLCYRAEVEAALRTEGMSGISLLGLQDFPGQGTALVGMMNAHLEPKPYPFAKPERFAAFFRDSLPVLALPRFTWTEGEWLEAEMSMAHFGRDQRTGRGAWSLSGESVRMEGALEERTCAAGALTGLGTVRFRLPVTGKPRRLELTVAFGGERNTYPLWVYPAEESFDAGRVHECRALDGEAEQVLAAGGCVFLSPDSTEAALPGAVKPQFSTDFWSVCTFPEQSGCMGQLIDDRHPVFEHFPTSFHTDWQWWNMAGQRAMVIPRRLKPIIREMDSYAFLRPMAQLFECRCGGGRLMVSSLGLHRLDEHPEARALRRAILQYMNSERFLPEQEMTPEEIRRLVRAV